jgi:uncharacterized OB-fold protein
MRSDRYLPNDWVLPEITDMNRAFFTSGELLLQKCVTCSKIQHPPLEVCNTCQSFEFDYIVCSSLGTVDSYSIVHHPVHEMLNESVPYNVCVISLDEYPTIRVVGNVIGSDPTVHIGLPVKATWAEVYSDQIGGTLLLPQWEPR